MNKGKRLISIAKNLKGEDIVESRLFGEAGEGLAKYLAKRLGGKALLAEEILEKQGKKTCPAPGGIAYKKIKEYRSRKRKTGG